MTTDKERADKEKADREKAAIANRDHDPNHPANKTLSPAPRTGAHPAGTAESASIPPEDMMTAQEADQTGAVPGVGPVSASEVSPGPVETIEDQGIGPRTPYPEGNPPPPSDADLANIEAAKKAPVKKVEPKPAHKEPAHQREPIR